MRDRKSSVVAAVAVSAAIAVAAPSAVMSSPARSATPTAGALSCAGALSWQRAGRVVGRVATIVGPVASTKYASWSNGSPTFLNMGVPYPNPRRFTVVIWIENRAAFGRPEVRYRGRTICVRGTVRTYQGVPEIFARSPSQIQVVR
jgi:hypothetical protein